MEENARFGNLIGDIYDAALDPLKWSSLAPKIAAEFGAESCALQARTAAGVQLLSVTANITPVLMQEYVLHHHKFDEWAIRALARPYDAATIGEELISTSELMNGPFGEWQRKVGQQHLVGAIVSVGASELGIIGVHRNSRPFDDMSKLRMASFIPHFRRALQLERELGKERLKRQSALEGLARLATALLLVDGDGRILFANEVGIAFLREGDGLAEAGGRLQARTESATSSLLGLIAACASTATGRGGHTGGAVSLPRRTRRPLSVLVSPFRADAVGFAASNGLAIVFVRDPTKEGLTHAKTLQALFNLTPAEARVAVALADGKSIEQFAEHHRYSIHTARTLLRRVMLKTDTKRQGELIALLLRSSGALRDAKIAD